VCVCVCECVCICACTHGVNERVYACVSVCTSTTKIANIAVDEDGGESIDTYRVWWCVNSVSKRLKRGYAV
jgi:hypothetical protein